MKWLIGILVWIVISVEITIRWLQVPSSEDWCLHDSNIFKPSREEVCSCYTDKIISKRYDLVIKNGHDIFNRILGDKEALDSNSQYNRYRKLLFQQCRAIQDYDVKEEIKQILHKDITNNDKFNRLLSSTQQHLLEDLSITEYNIQVLPDNMLYRYVVDVEVTAKVRVFFGVVEYQSYQGELHYNVQGQVIHSLSNWKRSKKHVDPSGLFNGIKQAKEFFDEN